MSDESGVEGVYVTPFPAGGRKIRISTGGLTAHPRWTSRRIVYFSLPSLTIMAANVQVTDDGVSVGPARPLFKPGYVSGTRSFDVSEDGERFVVIRAADQDEPDEINLLINWPALLRR